MRYEFAAFIRSSRVQAAAVKLMVNAATTKAVFTKIEQNMLSAVLKCSLLLNNVAYI